MKLQKIRITIGGYSLIESLVAIGLVLLLIIIFSASSTIILNNRSLRHTNLAYNLAVEEIEALRSIPFTELTNKTDAPLIEVAHNIGSWTVSAPSSPSSSPNVLELALPGTLLTGVTGTAIAPGFDYSNPTIEAQVKILPDSPSNWKTGFYIRYHDSANYYRVSFTSTVLYVDKIVNGIETTLDSESRLFAENTWHKLKVETSGSTFNVYVDDTLEMTIDDPGNSLNLGRIGLAGLNSTHAYFDDVSITGDTTQSWNFDADETGDMPSSWKRFGINDLPSGVGKLTIEDDQPGFSTLKNVTVVIEWKENENNRSVQLETMITQR